MSLFLDVEATGLNPRKDNIVGVAVLGDGYNNFYTPQNFKNENLWSNALFQSIIMHNAKYDLAMLQKAGYSLNNVSYHDTMLMSYLLDPERKCGHGLKALAKEYLGVADITTYEDLLGDSTEIKDIDPAKLAEYAKKDVDYTQKLFRFFRDQFDQPLRELYDEVEIPLVKTLIDIESRGIKIDTAYLTTLKTDLTAKLDKLALKFAYLYPGINVNSPKQLCTLLYGQLGLKATRKTEHGAPSTDNFALEEMAGQHEAVDLIRNIRRFNKLLGTYVNKFIDLAEQDPDGLMYPEFHQCVTATGRLASSGDFNMQNIPPEVRKAFVPRNGCTFVQADLSQIEPRIMAHLSGDKLLIAIFNADQDVYVEMGRRMWPSASEAELQEKRRYCKVAWLALSYGANAYKISMLAKANYHIALTLLEAKELVEALPRVFPRLWEWRTETLNYVKRHAGLRTYKGQIRYFPVFNNPYAQRWEIAAGEREAFNTMVQGPAAIIMKRCLNELHRQKYRILSTVHDDVLIEVDSHDADAEGINVEEIMGSIETLRVPIKAEVKIQKYWS